MAVPEEIPETKQKTALSRGVAVFVIYSKMV
jgi:hypothetical protein